MAQRICQKRRSFLAVTMYVRYLSLSLVLSSTDETVRTWLILFLP